MNYLRLLFTGMLSLFATANGLPQKPRPFDALPEIELNDSLSPNINGEEIRLVAFQGTHDNSDTIVWFTCSKVDCVGVISSGFHYPPVDWTGDILKYAKILKIIYKNF